MSRSRDVTLSTVNHSELLEQCHVPDGRLRPESDCTGMLRLTDQVEGEHQNLVRVWSCVACETELAIGHAGAGRGRLLYVLDPYADETGRLSYVDQEFDTDPVAWPSPHSRT